MSIKARAIAKLKITESSFLLETSLNAFKDNQKSNIVLMEQSFDETCDNDNIEALIALFDRWAEEAKKQIDSGVQFLQERMKD